MFLSRIELDTRLDKTRRAIAIPAMIHASVEGCFPRREEGNARKLWRLDTLQKRMYLLLLSPERPDFTSFAAQFCSRDAVGETKNYDGLLSRIDAGQIWRFRLRANAAHSVANGENARGKIHAHITAAHQCGWLMKKAGQCGFALSEGMYDAVESDTMRFRRSTQRDRPVTLGAVVYEGELAVTDAGLFRTALVAGVGRAKAYGCGLLTIARPS